MNPHYEIYRQDESYSFDDTLDEAIAFAEANGDTTICEIGGGWSEFGKCWFCEEWVDLTAMNRDSLCEKCESYLISRGEI